ncbi:MAG: hypothetical protein ABSF59_22080 [Candidatus Sulfotelmatobacter sp.]
MPLLSGVIAMQYAINEGLDDANKYLLLCRRRALSLRVFLSA